MFYDNFIVGCEYPLIHFRTKVGVAELRTRTAPLLSCGPAKMPTDAKLLGHKRPGRSTFIEDNFDNVLLASEIVVAIEDLVSIEGFIIVVKLDVAVGSTVRVEERF